MELLNSTSSETLTKRGLGDVVVKADWRLSTSGDYFLIPITLIDGTIAGWHAKYNLKEENRRLYGKVNLKGKPADIHYFMLPGLRSAIDEADGWLYLASGITDCLSYHAAGLSNVIAPLGGEMAIPQDFAKDLISWGVKGLIYLPDNDDIGAKSAAKVAARLEGSGLDYRVRRLNPIWKDINELWQYCLPLGEPVSQKTFRDVVRTARRIHVQATASTKSKAAARQSKHSGGKQGRRKWQAKHQAMQDVAAILGITKFRDEKSLPICCYFHADKKPSAVLFLNEDSGMPFYHCSGCGLKLTFRELCEKLGIKDFRDYQKTVDVSSSQLDDKPLPEETEIDGISGGTLESTMLLEATRMGLDWSQLENATCLPQGLRKTLLTAGYDRVAVFMDILLSKGVPLGQPYSSRDLHKLVETYYSYGTLRNMLKQFCTRFASAYRDSSVTENPVFYLVSFSSTENCVQNSNRGRREKAYMIPNLADLAMYFRLSKVGFCHPLPPSALESPKSYRKAVHEQNVEAAFLDWHEDDNFPPTATMSDEIGICARTLSSYEREQETIGKLRRFLRKEVEASYQPSNREKKLGIRVVQRGEKYYQIRPLTSIRWFKYSASGISKMLVCSCCLETPLSGDQANPPKQCDYCGADHPWIAMDISPKDIIEEPEETTANLIESTATEADVTESGTPVKKDLHCKYCSQMPMFVDNPGDHCDYCKAMHPWQNQPPLVTTEPPEHEKWVDPNQKKKRKPKKADMKTMSENPNPSGERGHENPEAPLSVDDSIAKTLPYWEFLFEDSSEYLHNNEAAKLIKAGILKRLDLTEEMLAEQQIGYNAQKVCIVINGRSAYVPTGIIFPLFVGHRLHAVSVYRWTGSELEPVTTVIADS